MKMFSALSLLSVVLVALVGQTVLAIPASNVSNSYGFTISSIWDFGGRVYYNCDSVEDAAKDMLQHLGARNISVQCTGGLDHNGMPPMEAYLRVSYDSLKASGSGDPSAIQAYYTAVELRGYQDCFLAQQLFKKFVPTFDTKDVSSVRRCTEASGSYLYRLSVLK